MTEIKQRRTRKGAGGLRPQRLRSSSCKYVLNYLHITPEPDDVVKVKVSVFMQCSICSTRYLTLKTLRHGSHSFTSNYTNACLYLVSVHQMAPPRLGLRTSNCSLLLIYLPWKDERLSRPGWLTYSGRFTHISGHPSAAGRAQDRESSPVKDQRSTTVPRNQPTSVVCLTGCNGAILIL